MDENNVGIIEEMSQAINSILDENRNISDILTLWEEVNLARKSIDKVEERIKSQVKIYLKERKWIKYFDEQTKISVSITQIKQQTYDKQQIKLMLNESQLAQILITTTYERLNIVTEENRERLKQIARGPKNSKKTSKTKRKN